MQQTTGDLQLHLPGERAAVRCPDSTLVLHQSGKQGVGVRAAGHRAVLAMAAVAAAVAVAVVVVTVAAQAPLVPVANEHTCPFSFVKAQCALHLSAARRRVRNTVCGAVLLGHGDGSKCLAYNWNVGQLGMLLQLPVSQLLLSTVGPVSHALAC